MQLTPLHIEQLRKQHAPTQKMVFDHLFSTMFRVCQRYVVRIDEAEDCVMKGFMKAFQQIDRFEYVHELSFMHWLKRIMVNESLMAIRKQTNLGLVAIEDNPTDLALEDELLQQLDAKYLFDVIMKLPPGYRTVLNMFVVEGYSHQEIAETLGITESTSKTQLAKAKQKIKGLITQAQYGYGNG